MGVSLLSRSSTNSAGHLEVDEIGQNQCRHHHDDGNAIEKVRYIAIIIGESTGNIMQYVNRRRQVKRSNVIDDQDELKR